MERINYSDYFNDNEMDVTTQEKGRYVSFYVNDIDSGESVQVSLSTENIKKLIEQLSKVV